MKTYVLLFLVVIFGCNERHIQPSKQMVFGWYNQSDSLIKAKLFNLTAYDDGLNDSILITSQDTVFCSYKQFIDTSGIYRFCDGQEPKTHSFKDTLITEYCKSCPPFLNKNVSFRNEKIYAIGKKQFVIYHFIENTGNHSTYDSYFLKEVGPVCYYSFDRDDYIFCDSAIGYDVTSAELDQLKKNLLSDTTFFARFILRRLMPNYYRPSPGYNSF